MKDPEKVSMFWIWLCLAAIAIGLCWLLWLTGWQS
jgi:hypothetical protein